MDSKCWQAPAPTRRSESDASRGPRAWPRRSATGPAGRLVAAALAFGSGVACAAEPSTGILRVALLLPGRENDGGWNQLAFEAARALESDTVKVSHTNTPNAAALKSDLRDYAQQNYDLVICHGGEFLKSAREIAKKFPRTRVVVTGSGEGGDGVTTLDFQLWQATYLCGVLAGKLVPDGHVGLIGAQNFSTVKNTLDAFANGVRSVTPDRQVHYEYTGSWDDIAKARQTTRSLIDAFRVTVIFQNTDAAARGVFDAAGTVYAFGSNHDQAPLAPQVVPASAVIDMKRAFALLVDELRAGRLESRNYVHDLSTGGVNVLLNSAFKDKWPPGALDAMEAARRAIVAGQLDVLKPR